MLRFYEGGSVNAVRKEPIMSDTAAHDAAAASSRAAKPFVTVSVITPKPGGFDEFMERQLAQQRRLRGTVRGLIGGRLLRSLDNRTAVLIAAFETEGDALRFRQDKRLVDHIAGMQPLIDSAMAGTYEAAYAVGEV
jgi:heme-degrading monooxygenase HmoA